jgi:enamine deaminase RidA (YjgF/YER057c/UK114 family)
MTEIERIQPEGLLASPAYTHVVASRSGRTVHVSGQVAMDATGAVVGVGDLGAQTTQVMENLRTALGAVGATFADVVKITTYVVGYRPEQRAVIAAARSPFFGAGEPPASTLVGVSALAAPDWLIEIEAVAVLD